MAVKIKSNVRQAANNLGKMANPDAEILAANNLDQLARRYIPVFALATPKRTGTAARSLSVQRIIINDEVRVVMRYGVDYINDVNDGEGENRGFFTNQFKSLQNRIKFQGAEAINNAYKSVAAKNGLKVI